MSSFVLIVGAVVLAFSALFLIAPGIVKLWFRRMLESRRFTLVGVLRIAIGLVFGMAAGGTRLPLLVGIVGLLSVVSGAALLVVDPERVRGIARWGLERTDGVLRLWAFAAGALGAALMWAAG